MPPPGSDMVELMKREHSERYLNLIPFFTVHKLMDASGLNFTDHMIMVKNIGYKGERLAINHEHFFILSKGRYKLREHNGPATSAWVQEQQEDQSHSIFDPNVVHRLLDQFTDEDDLVLDPMAGSGMVGKVALDMNREAVLYEIDPTRLEQIRATVGRERIHVRGRGSAQKPPTGQEDNLRGRGQTGSPGTAQQSQTTIPA